MKFETIVNKQYRGKLKIHIVDPDGFFLYTGYVISSYVYTKDGIKRVGIKPFVGLNVENCLHGGVFESTAAREDNLPLGYDVIVDGRYNRRVTTGFKTHEEEASRLVRKFLQETQKIKELPKSLTEYLKLAKTL